MSPLSDPTLRRSDLPSCKAIYCILPDDGTDKRVLAELRDKQGVIRAGSGTRRGLGVLGATKTKRGKLPESQLVKQLFVICEEDRVDEVFDLIFWSAQIDKPGRGGMWQRAVTGCTPFELPADIPDEEAGV